MKIRLDFELVSLAVLVMHQLVGFRVLHELLDDRVPRERTVQLHGDVADVADGA